MTDEKFTELVNSYFDKEISADDLKRLKSEISSCPRRKQAFAERLRLHKAMRMALKPGSSRSARSRRHPRRRGGRYQSASKISRYDESFGGYGQRTIPRWLLGSGLVASLAIGFLLLSPVFRDTTSPGAQPELVGVSKDDLSLRDPLVVLDRAQFQRYIDAQKQREADYHASLIAQMRLMGLRPELTPKDKQLREVRLAAYHEPKREVNQAELFQRIQAMKAMPDPQLLELEENESNFNSVWPNIFKSSLVGIEEL